MLTIDEDFELKIPIQSREDFENMDFNVTDIFLNASPSGSTEANAVTSDYEQFLADVWVGIVLTLMVLSCVCFMCSCLIYHKFQQWKHRGKFQYNFITLLAGTVTLLLEKLGLAL